MFQFQQFGIVDDKSSMKVGTDAVVLGAWASIPIGRCQICDIGTGCGVIALMLAQRNPEASIMAIDIDSGSIEDARTNVAASSVGKNVEVREGDIFEMANQIGHFDLVVSNPPYFTETLLSPLASRARARHESRLGISSLIELSQQLLKPEGRLAFISPCNREGEIMMAIEIAGMKVTRMARIRKRNNLPPSRTLWEICRSQCPGQPYKEETIVLDSPEGKALTAEFYLKKP